jgi:hypothetical protein
MIVGLPLTGEEVGAAGLAGGRRLGVGGVAGLDTALGVSGTVGRGDTACGGVAVGAAETWAAGLVLLADGAADGAAAVAAGVVATTLPGSESALEAARAPQAVMSRQARTIERMRGCIRGSTPRDRPR